MGIYGIWWSGGTGNGRHTWPCGPAACLRFSWCSVSSVRTDWAQRVWQSGRVSSSSFCFTRMHVSSSSTRWQSHPLGWLFSSLVCCVQRRWSNEIQSWSMYSRQGCNEAVVVCPGIWRMNPTKNTRGGIWRWRMPPVKSRLVPPPPRNVIFHTGQCLFQSHLQYELCSLNFGHFANNKNGTKHSSTEYNPTPSNLL
jgi:hypothetical protein